ncbi:hypothetical protein [Sulfurisphaera ohwakuensis]|uniref:Uncharacterized protein n=1 Tax=Sulfurisphaera ohwakuensis TaxID=69656 RepID=A0A7J9RXS9_SULOH|nr:hypothetical protein [Sulfurisphaera ohwakuensis]MBB5254869.1 hypothetical protein [Sulfurisphaera ohwakuensis]
MENNDQSSCCGYELRFFVTLTSGIRLDSEYCKVISFLKHKKQKTGYFYLKKKIRDF